MSLLKARDGKTEKVVTTVKQKLSLNDLTNPWKLKEAEFHYQNEHYSAMRKNILMFCSHFIANFSFLGIKNPVSVANRLLCEGQKGKLSAGRIPPW